MNTLDTGKLTVDTLIRAKRLLDTAPVPDDIMVWPPQDRESREALIERRRKDNARIILELFGVNRC